MRRWGVFLAVVIGLAACGSRESYAQNASDAAARTAGIVLGNAPHVETALAATRGVTGIRPPTTIEVLQASGDRMAGFVTLRITVGIRGESLRSGSSSTRCYGFTLGHFVAGPQREPCPAAKPIADGVKRGLPIDAWDSVLRALGSASTVGAVVAAMRQTFRGAGYGVRVMAVHATIGVLLLASDGQCFFARRRQTTAAVSPMVQAWIVPKPPRPVSDFYCLPDRAASGSYVTEPPPPSS